MSELPPHVRRMEAEEVDLRERKEALEAFILGGTIYRLLDATDQGLLRAQLGAMRAYHEVLQVRLDIARKAA